jgi:hypothetical protein
MNFGQADFEVRCEWGEKGILQLAPISDVLVIVDVLSFQLASILLIAEVRSFSPISGKMNLLKRLLNLLTRKLQRNVVIAVILYLQLHCLPS